MPRRKKVKIEDIKGFEDTDESLLVNLPIKIKKETTNESLELSKLRKENKELKEQLSSMLANNLNKVKVIRNNNGNNIKCWWCGGCSEKSIILPDKKINNKFYGNGSYCSFNCALSSNFSINDEKVWERCSLLYQLKDSMNIETSSDKIIPAPPKEVLKEFGGEMSRDEYNSMLESVDHSFIKLLPPMISSTILIEQRNKGSNNLTQLNLLGLKLKRTKTPAKNKYNLDSIIS